MKLALLLSLFVLFVSYFRVDSQDLHQSFRSTALELKKSENESYCDEKCIQEKNTRNLQDSNTAAASEATGRQNVSAGDIINDHLSDIYKDLADHAQEQAKNTWNSLSSGAKAGIIIAVVVVAVIIIAGIIHCLCICKLCCCC